MVGFRIRLLAVLVLTAGAPLLCAAASDPVAEIESHYQTVLAMLKKPPVSGVLITEVEPGSPVEAAELWAGDIITECYGKKVETLAALREQLALALATHIDDPASGDRVALRARRGPNGENPIAVQVPRGALSIRAIDVQAGVPGPRNPPANLRGTIAFDWSTLLAEAADAETRTIAMKTFLRIPSDAQAAVTGSTSWDEEWFGWETLALSSDSPGTLLATMDVNRVDPGDTASTPVLLDHAAYAVQMQLSDIKSSPAYLVEQVSAKIGVGDGTGSSTGNRVGAMLRTEVVIPRHPAEHHEFTVPQNALIQPALPLAACALPHEPGMVQAVTLLSERGLLPMPGYVLVTRGKLPVPGATGTGDSAKEFAWQVDLLFCGVTVESYWFSDQRRVLATESQGTQPLISRRVANAKIAATPMVLKSATQPATRDAR